jgi:hypothetical protein
MDGAGGGGAEGCLERGAASWITSVVLPLDGRLTAGLLRMAKDLSPE